MMEVLARNHKWKVEPRRLNNFFAVHRIFVLKHGIKCYTCVETIPIIDDIFYHLNTKEHLKKFRSEAVPDFNEMDKKFKDELKTDNYETLNDKIITKDFDLAVGPENEQIDREKRINKKQIYSFPSKSIDRWYLNMLHLETKYKENYTFCNLCDFSLPACKRIDSAKAAVDHCNLVSHRTNYLKFLKANPDLFFCKKDIRGLRKYNISLSLFTKRLLELHKDSKDTDNSVCTNSADLTNEVIEKPNALVIQDYEIESFLTGLELKYLILHNIIKSNCDSFLCLCCNITLFGISDAWNHARDWGHMKKLQEIVIIARNKQSLREVTIKLPKPKHSFNGYSKSEPDEFSNTNTDATINSPDITSNISLSDDDNKLFLMEKSCDYSDFLESNELSIISPTLCRCAKCKKNMFTTINDVLKHVNSEQHKSKLIKLDFQRYLKMHNMAYISETNDVLCTCCNIFENSKKTILKHIESEKHKENIKINLEKSVQKSQGERKYFNCFVKKECDFVDFFLEGNKIEIKDNKQCFCGICNISVSANILKILEHVNEDQTHLATLTGIYYMNFLCINKILLMQDYDTFQCMFCNSILKGKIKILKHVRSKRHSDQICELVKSNVINKKLNNESNLYSFSNSLNHTEQEKLVEEFLNGNSISSTTNGSYSCDICDTTEIQSIDEVLKHTTLQKHTSRFVCDMYTFYLGLHQIVQIKDEKYTCKYCNKMVVTVNRAMSHVKSEGHIHYTAHFFNEVSRQSKKVEKQTITIQNRVLL